jgi:hypothetical protein
VEWQELDYLKAEYGDLIGGSLAPLCWFRKEVDCGYEDWERNSVGCGAGDSCR